MKLTPEEKERTLEFLIACKSRTEKNIQQCLDNLEALNHTLARLNIVIDLLQGTQPELNLTATLPDHG